MCGRPSLTLDSALVHQKKINNIATKASHHKTRTNHLIKSKHLTTIFILFCYFIIIKQDREHSGQLCKWHNASRPQTNRQKNKHEEPTQMCRLGMASNEINGGGGGLVCLFAVDLSSAWFLRHLVVRFPWKIPSS